MLAIFLFFGWLFVFPIAFNSSLSGTPLVIAVELLTLPLAATVLNLPQAIILWNEPDVPEEARDL